MALCGCAVHRILSCAKDSNAFRTDGEAPSTKQLPHAATIRDAILQKSGRLFDEAFPDHDGASPRAWRAQKRQALWLTEQSAANPPFSSGSFRDPKVCKGRRVRRLTPSSEMRLCSNDRSLVQWVHAQKVYVPFDVRGT